MQNVVPGGREWMKSSDSRPRSISVPAHGSGWKSRRVTHAPASTSKRASAAAKNLRPDLVRSCPLTATGGSGRPPCGGQHRGAREIVWRGAPFMLFCWESWTRITAGREVKGGVSTIAYWAPTQNLGERDKTARPCTRPKPGSISRPNLVGNFGQDNEDL